MTMPNTELQASFQMLQVVTRPKATTTPDFGELVRQVAQLKEKIHRSEVATWELRVALGEKLLEAKDRLRGRYLQFLRVVNISQPVAWRYVMLAKKVRELRAKDPNFSIAKAVWEYRARSISYSFPNQAARKEIEQAKHPDYSVEEYSLEDEVERRRKLEDYSLANDLEGIFDAPTFHGHRRKRRNLTPEGGHEKLQRWWKYYNHATSEVLKSFSLIEAETCLFSQIPPSSRRDLEHSLWVLIQRAKQALYKLTTIDGFYDLGTGYRELYDAFPHYLLQRHLYFLDTRLGRGQKDFWHLVEITKGDTEAPAYVNTNGVAVNTAQYCERLLSSMVSHSLNGGQVGKDLAKTTAFLNSITQTMEVNKNGSK